MDLIEKLNKLRELADEIIINEEWIDIRTIQYSPEDFTIECNGHEIAIKANDTEKTIREKIKTLADQRLEDIQKYFELSEKERIEKYLSEKRWNDWSE